jgi:hypothetical protein
MFFLFFADDRTRISASLAGKGDEVTQPKRHPRIRHSLYLLFFAIVSVGLPAQALAELYDLKNLTAAQREILSKELEKYADVTGAMNYCERPPFLERRVRAAASGCVTPESLDVIEAQFKDSVARSSGRINCADKNLQRIFDTAAQKMGYLIDDITKACKLRILYNFRLF